MLPETNKKLHNEPRIYKHIDALYNWKHGKHFLPPFIEISPVSYCNQKCKFCYTTDLMKKAEIMPGKTLLSLIDGLVKVKTKGLRIQGIGEPTIHKDLPDAIFKAGSNGIDTGLTTNGVLMNNKMLDRCMEQLFSIKISVIDSDSKRYANFHRVHESHWKKVIENVKYAANLKSKKNYRTILHTTIYAEDSTYDHIKNIVKFCKDIGFDLVTVSNANYSERTPEPKKIKNNFIKTKDKHIQYLKDIEEDIQKLESGNFEVEVSLRNDNSTAYVDETKKINCPKMGMKFYTLIDAKGFVYPCWRYWGKVEYAYGNINEHPFDEIWKSKEKKKVDSKIETEYFKDSLCNPCGHERINKQLQQLQRSGGWENFLT